MSVVRKLVAVLGLKYNKGSFIEANATLNTIKDTMGAIVDLFNIGSKVLEEFLVVAARREALEVSFGVLFNNVELGKQKLAELDKFAAETPLSVAQVRKNAVMLTAMGTSVSELIPEMKVLSNITAAFPNLTLERLALNFGQVRAQGHLTGREWRDFAVGGIDVLTPIGKKLGKTKTELRDMMSKRLISFDMVKAAFVEMTKEGGLAHKMLEKQAETAKGMWAILKSNILLVKEAIGDAILPIFKKMLKEIIAWVKANKDLIVEALLIYFKTLAYFAKTFFWLLKQIIKLLPDLKNVVRALKAIVGLAALIGLGALAFQASGMPLTLSRIVFWLGLIAKKLLLIGIRLAVIMAPILWIAAKFAAIGAAIAAIVLFFESADLFFRGLREGFETKTIFGDMFKDMPVVLALMEPIIAGLRVISALFLSIFTDYEFKEIFDDAVVKNFSKTVRKSWSAAIDWIKQAFIDLWDTVAFHMEIAFANLIERVIGRINFIVEKVNAVTGVLPFGDALKIEKIAEREAVGATFDPGDKYVTNYINASVAEGESGNFMRQINDASDEFNPGPMSYVEE